MTLYKGCFFQTCEYKTLYSARKKFLLIRRGSQEEQNGIDFIGWFEVVSLSIKWLFVCPEHFPTQSPTFVSRLPKS